MVNRTEDEIWHLLEQVPDPELPIVNLVELGVIRKVKVSGVKVKVTITPTYTACPAKKLFADLIREKLEENAISDIEIETQLSPAWSTDWLSAETLKKLNKEGVAPPTNSDKTVICPRCGSSETSQISRFGSTPCMAMYKCRKCLEPFSYFKCHR